MNKSTQILVGVGVVGLVVYLYLQNKKKAAADALKQQKIAAMQKNIDTMLLSGDFLRVNSDNKSDNNAAMLQKLKKTIDANLLSVDELQKISDGLDLYLGNYVGTKKKETIGNEMNDVLSKYNIS
jgi:hypothetical protein